VARRRPRSRARKAEAAPPGAPPNDPGRRSWIWIPALAVLSAAWTFLGTRGNALLGFDSYPIILTARIRSLPDFIGTFTEKLMDGRFDGGDFYRPVVNLSFALDHALWGLAPAGYHLTDALLFGACVAVTGLLGRRLLGGRAWAGLLVMMAVFVLHPSHVEVLPVPSRRAEFLCWLFMAAALWLQLAPRSLRSPRPPVLPAVLGLLAMGSKETAFLLPGFVVLAVTLYSPRPRLGERVTQALGHAIPHAVALAVALLARWAVLGGMGGYTDVGSGGVWARLPRTMAAGARLLVAPQPSVESGGILGVPGSGLLLMGAALAAGLVLFLGRRPGSGDPARPTRPWNAVVLGAGLAAGFLATFSMAGRVASWYLFLPVGALAVLAGGLAEIAAGAVHGRRFWSRGTGVIGLLLLAAFAVDLARTSPFLRHYPEWERATRASNAFLADLEPRIRAAPDGTAVPAPDFPRWVRVGPDSVAARGAAILTGRSLQAWVDLRFPHRRVTVIRGAMRDPGPDEVLVVPTSFAPGLDGP